MVEESQVHKESKQSFCTCCLGAFVSLAISDHYREVHVAHCDCKLTMFEVLFWDQSNFSVRHTCQCSVRGRRHAVLTDSELAQSAMILMAQEVLGCSTIQHQVTRVFPQRGSAA